MLLWHVWWSGFVLGVDDNLRALEVVADVIDCRLLWLDRSWQKDSLGKELLWERLLGDSVRLCEADIWGSRLSSYFSCSPRRHAKVAAVVARIESRAEWGSVESLVHVIDAFAQTAPGSWLKVAGGDKANVLTESLHRRTRYQHGAAIEFGAFIGYTTIRLSRQYRSHDWMAKDANQRLSILSFEGDPVHAAVARRVIDRACASELAEVCMGQVKDAMPCLSELFGLSAVGFVFMDQGGSSFCADHRQLERLGCLLPGGRSIADNIVRPGAPLFISHASRSGEVVSVSWSLPEFLEAHLGVEDWMVSCQTSLPQYC